jgi:hypothetical protein
MRPIEHPAKGHPMKTLPIAAALLVVSTAAGAATCRVSSPAYTMAVIELYTSQGCSSCPPADRWLSRLPAGDPRFRAIPLALHIGYWDYIGWKDPFARKEFNNRQYQLAEHNAAGRVYTPEVFVGARELADWNRSDSVAAALAAINARAPLADIDLQAHWLAGTDPASQRLAVQARWTADRSARDPQLVLAVKRSGFVTQVQAGENSGASLRNDHVVRAWAGPFKPGGQALTTELSVPASPGEASLVAIAQDAGTGAVLQAVELPLAACEVPPGQ